MVVLSFLTAGLLVGCAKADVSQYTPDAQEAFIPELKASTSTGSQPVATPSAPSYSVNVNWNRPDGAYGLTQAITDFTNVPFWGDQSRSNITGSKFRTTLLKNSIGGAGGVISRIDVPDGSEYQMQFDMMFDSQFDFSAGGKVGFGFLIGKGYTGGTPGTDGNGGSARLMWYKGWDGRVYLKPYVYYKDQPGTYGNDFAKTYPTTGSIAKNQWYTVKMYVKCNTGANTNGRIRMEINGTVVMDQAIRWTTNDLERMVKNICFETFRGGAETYWQSATDGQIFFDNLSYTKIQ